jgi:hypothetical protein
VTTEYTRYDRETGIKAGRMTGGAVMISKSRKKALPGELTRD